MTPEQVKAIQHSFAQVAPDVAAAWIAAYTVLSDFMIGEACGHSVAAG